MAPDAMTFRTRLMPLLVLALLASPVWADDAVDAEVDVLMRLIGSDARERAAGRLRELGPAAVPRLLRHLQSTNADVRIYALACLQHAWSEEALEPMLRQLRVGEPKAKQIVFGALWHHLPRERFVDVLTPLANDADIRVAGPVMQMVDPLAPDAERLLRWIDKPIAWKFVAPLLSGHDDARLTPGTRAMLVAEDDEVKVGAVRGLIEQGAADDDTRRRLTLLLRQSPTAREAAAEYLRRVGVGEAHTEVARALQKERDVHRAALLRAVLGEATPEGRAWVAPVRGYPGGRRWDGVAEDAGFGGAYAPVVAMGAGVVVLAGGGRGVVVVEHREDDGLWCIVYANLAAPLGVEVRQAVRPGQFVGAIARGVGHEPARLRLALRRGAFGDGAWVGEVLTARNPGLEDKTRRGGGYGGGGWVEPGAFLKERGVE